MDETAVFELGRNALIITLILALPMLSASLITGLLISLFQAVTQINEITLTFVPKILVFFLVLALLGPWMLQQLLGYTIALFNSLPGFSP
ncbi:MAG TPA: flagellar biosynthesis protein FliQ [Anaerolineae bacterium]|nr:flagellar biosynthesis protein FliQ [Anaerolineae bacterium]